VIDLPDTPAPNAADPGMMDFGALLTPALGGPVQRVERPGNRFRYSVTMPPMQGATARKWISALVRGKQEGARIDFIQQGFSPGVPGSPTVNGAGQSGRTLAIEGAEPNYVVRDGQFFNHVDADGQHYLYMNVGETILDSSGDGTLDIEPMLRVSPDDGDELKFSNVKIEGWIRGDEQMWNLALGGLVNLAFDIEEAR
jgi:hypothetical protein